MKAEDLLNHTIAHYRLIEILGKGGMSIVFLAQHLENPQDTVAIKILMPSDFAATDEFALFQARFRREAQAVHQLHHEHILPVLDYGEEEDGLFYMILPLMAGGTLAQLLASTSGLLPLDEIASYLNQLTSAVDYSNQHGMVHRDIKPSNVLIDEEKNIYLADFGIVRLFDSSHLALDEAPSTLTTVGKIYGTPAYMAPERFKGEPAEPATDMYALGVLLYQLVTGQVPFDADNALALGMKHLNEEPLRPRFLRPDLPEPSEAAILKALAKQPADRFANAEALAAAFEAGLQGEWVTELLPLAAVLVARPLSAQGEQPMAAPVAVLEEDAQTERLGYEPAPEAAMSNLPIAFAPTVMDVPAVARRESHSWRNIQAFSLGMLVVVLLLFTGLFALAVSRLGNSTPPSPGIHVLPTNTNNSPAKNSTTPTSSAGAGPSSSGSTSTPTTSPTPTTGSGSTPTPTPGIAPTPTTPPLPTATTPPPPTATTAPVPSPTPTAGAAP